MGCLSKSHSESDPITTSVARPANWFPVTAPPSVVPAVPQTPCASFSLGGKAGAPHLGSCPIVLWSAPSLLTALGVEWTLPPGVRPTRHSLEVASASTQMLSLLRSPSLIAAGPPTLPALRARPLLREDLPPG